MDLASLTWTDVDAGGYDAAFVPVGSVEQHGPHAPLGTDLFIARAVAGRGARRATPEPLVTPAVPVGIAPEHRQFPGSLRVPPAAFRAYVRGIAEALAGHGVSAVVFVNGHGGNVAALEQVADDLTRAGICRAAAFTWFDAIDDPPAPMGHGGLLETACVMAIDPELVRGDRIAAAAEGASERWGDWVGGTNLAVDVDEFAENGVVGDPSGASAEVGEALLTEAAEALAAVCEALRDRAG